MSDPKPVDAVDPAKKTSKITGPVDDDATVLTTNADVKCYWNDEEFDNGDVKIEQVIYIQRDSQKAIVLGKGGSRIKALGQSARGELEEIFGRRVHLKLFVKVQENWPERPESLQLMGLDTNI